MASSSEATDAATRPLTRVTQACPSLSSAIAVLVAFGAEVGISTIPIIATLASPVCDLKAAQQSGAASCGALYISGVSRSP
jgi:hypothetical protein